jgi:hypothetical protein
MNAVATFGSNAPADPHKAFALHIDDLFEEATNFLDGEPIANQAQADAVSALLNRLRKASNDADEQRKVEKKPHDDAGAAIQARWKPLLSKADLAAQTCKRALAPFLEVQEAERRRAVEAAQEEARQKAEAARQAAEQARGDDLASQTTVRSLHLIADEANKAAAKAEKQKVQAKGGERATTLRTRWVAEIVDRRAALNHYARIRPDDLAAWLQEQVDGDARRSLRNVPGVEYQEVRIAV